MEGRHAIGFQRPLASEAVETEALPRVIMEKGWDGARAREYERGKLLGKGGFAKVYTVQERGSGRQYAAKVVAKSAMKKPRSREMLMSEIKIHRALRHPSVVKFVRCFEDELRVYIILELCDSGTLNDVVRRRGRLSEAEARPILHQLVEALVHMHAHRVIHRDIKLGNVLLHEGTSVRVSDFGLAAQLEYDKQRKMTICGTPNYIAPEVLSGSREGGHSYEVDVWSFGVVMYTTLVGRPPFETANVKHTYRRIRDNDYTFPPSVNLSRAAKDLIASILSSDPEERPLASELLTHPFFLRVRAPVRQIPPPTPPPMDVGEPMKVCKWIDYSSKYGLGYQLRDGAFGAHFNDSSKMLLKGDFIDYINATGGFEGRMRSGDVPSKLKKKLTLLHNFRTYLQARQSPGQEEPSGDENAEGIVYMRNWWRVKHGFIFQLSGGEAQASFHDGSEVLVCSRTGAISYRSKRGRRELLHTAFLPDKPDLIKRLRYLREYVPQS